MVRFQSSCGGLLAGCVLWLALVVVLAWLVVEIVGFQVAVVSVLLLILLALLVRDGP